jgi:hypothetical protein
MTHMRVRRLTLIYFLCARIANVTSNAFLLLLGCTASLHSELQLRKLPTGWQNSMQDSPAAFHRGRVI